MGRKFFNFQVNAEGGIVPSAASPFHLGDDVFAVMEYLHDPYSPLAFEIEDDMLGMLVATPSPPFPSHLGTLGQKGKDLLQAFDICFGPRRTECPNRVMVDFGDFSSRGRR